MERFLRWLYRSLAALFVLMVTTPLQAQSNQFGLLNRANAARQMIVLGVQQGISSLPPTSGQSFRYEFDPSVGQTVPTEELGPGAFRSAQTVGKGNVSLRVATSYFKLEDTFGPTDYLVEFDSPLSDGSQPAGVAGFGLDASAKVHLVNIGVSAGVMDRLELMFNLPVAVVDVNARQISSVFSEDVNLPPSEVQAGGFFGFFSPEDYPLPDSEIDFLRQGFHDCLVPNNPDCLQPPGLAYRKDSFSSLGANLENGSDAGVGRISLGGKYTFLDEKIARLAFSTEFFFASPNEDEFAGSATYSILPRLIGEVPLTMLPLAARVQGDIGYEHDFGEAELRRLVWNAGFSVPIDIFAFDFGVGGSRFNKEIEYSPAKTSGDGVDGVPVTLTALSDTGIGANFVDFIGGVKIKLLPKLVLSGVVNVPLTNDGFRADAVGTIGLEYYL